MYNIYNEDKETPNLFDIIPFGEESGCKGILYLGITDIEVESFFVLTCINNFKKGMLSPLKGLGYEEYEVELNKLNKNSTIVKTTSLPFVFHKGGVINHGYRYKEKHIDIITRYYSNDIGKKVPFVTIPFDTRSTYIQLVIRNIKSKCFNQ